MQLNDLLFITGLSISICHVWLEVGVRLSEILVQHPLRCSHLVLNCSPVHCGCVASEFGSLFALAEFACHLTARKRGKLSRLHFGARCNYRDG